MTHTKQEFIKKLEEAKQHIMKEQWLNVKLDGLDLAIMAKKNEEFKGEKK